MILIAICRRSSLLENSERSRGKFQKLLTRYSVAKSGIQYLQQTFIKTRSARPRGRGTSAAVVGSTSCHPVHL